ncbi:MAG: CaiB/BaiF CoA-transferase family protein [Deltaproteobacteria bacterium]|nr:CaiB/BaiF CoA-transferase family protein [Deltaproteobacteria bacterium]
MAALKGIRILDLTLTLPGPYCTHLLADFGAEVIKVENPEVGGDWFRTEKPSIEGWGIRFLDLNRNKKSITLNLKSSKGKEIFSALARTSQVIVEGFRPGVVERLGIDYRRMKEINPRIVYCSISGYGQDGPYRLLAGHDLNYMGYSGILDPQGYADRPPALPSVFVADYSGGGLMAAVGILVALMAAQREGKGQWVDISMFDGVVGLQHAALAELLSTGRSPKRGEFWGAGNIPCYSLYETKDGKAISLGPLEPHFWANLCRALGREDFIPHQWTEGEKRQEIYAFLRETFRQKDRDEWVALFQGQDVCLGPVKDMGETLQDPQVLHRQMIVEVEHPQAGRVKQIGIPIKLSETPGEINHPAPALGQHTEELLSELGYDRQAIEGLRREKAI